MNNFNMSGMARPGGPMSFPPPPNNNQISQFIQAKLQEQGPPQGWQTQITRQSRYQNIMQIFTQMKLQPNSNQTGDMEKMKFALTSEQHAYQTSQSPDNYYRAMSERSNALLAMRQNQAKMAFQNQNAANAAGNPLMPNGLGFGRGAPMAQMGMQMPMQNNMPNIMGPSGPQNAGMNMMRQPGPIGQPGPTQQAAPPVMFPNGQPNNTPRPPQAQAIQAEINQKASQIRTAIEQQGTAQQMREKAQQTVGPAMAAQFQGRGVDVLNVWIRQIAAQQVQSRYAQAGQANGQQTHQSMPMSQTTSQPGIPAGMRVPSGDGNKPGIDFAQVLGQQAAAERSQASGDLVVPASNNQNFQGPLGRGPFPNTFGINGNNPAGPGQAPGSIANSRPASSFQPGHMPGNNMSQPPPNFNTSASPAQNPFAPGPPNSLTGQPGGLHMPGPSPAMPNLNKPIGAPGSQTPQRPNPGMPRSHQPSPMPGVPMNQQPNPMQALGPGNMPNLLTQQGQEAVKQRFATLSAEQKDPYMRAVRSAMAQQQQRQQAQANSLPMNPPQPQPFGPGGLGLGQPGIPPNMRGPVPPGMPQPPSEPSQMASGLQPPNGMPGRMPPKLEQMMNSLPLPKDALNKRVPELDIPFGINDWAGLFDFLGKTPNALSHDSLKSLHVIRSSQFQLNINQRRNQGIGMNAGPGSFTNNAPFMNLPPDKQNMAAGLMELRGANVLEMNNTRQIRLKDVATQEIVAFRQRNSGGEAARASDAHIRGLLVKSRAEKTSEKLGQPFAKELLIRFAQANSVQIPSGNQAVPKAAPVPVAQPGQYGNASMANQPTQAGIGGSNQLRGPLSNEAKNLPSGAAQPGQGRPSQQSSMSKEEQTRLQEEMKKRAAQLNQTQRATPQQAPEVKSEWSSLPAEQKSQRFMQLSREVHSQAHRGPPMPLQPSAQNKQLIASVKRMADMQNQNLTTLRSFYLMSGNEKATREILSSICFMKNQLKLGLPAGPSSEVEITASPQELSANMKRLIHFHKFIQDRKSGAAFGNDAVSSQPAGQTTQQQQQPRAASRVDVKNEAAPPVKTETPSKGTNAQRPVPPMGVPQPDGSVQYFNDNQGKEFNLTIPPNKLKQRMSQAPTPGAPSTPVVKADAIAKSKPIPTSAPPKMDLHYKCSIPGCAFESIGFATQQEQQDHERNVHRYTGDSLRWCLGSLKESLGLNKPAALRKAAAARAPPHESSLKPPFPQSMAMKREISTRPVTPQGRTTSGQVAPDQRPGSAVGMKRTASSVQGQNEAEMGSPSKRSRPSPARVDTWQHSDWSRELMEEVWSDIARATVMDPLMGCRVPGFDMIEDSPPETPEKKEGGSEQEKKLSDEEHIQSLLNWKDPYTEALFQEAGSLFPQVTDGGEQDWFMVEPKFDADPLSEVTDEAIQAFEENGGVADLDDVFGSPGDGHVGKEHSNGGTMDGDFVMTDV